MYVDFLFWLPDHLQRLITSLSRQDLFLTREMAEQLDPRFDRMSLVRNGLMHLLRQKMEANPPVEALTASRQGHGSPPTLPRLGSGESRTSIHSEQADRNSMRLPPLNFDFQNSNGGYLPNGVPNRNNALTPITERSYTATMYSERRASNGNTLANIGSPLTSARSDVREFGTLASREGSQPAPSLRGLSQDAAEPSHQFAPQLVASPIHDEGKLPSASVDADNITTSPSHTQTQTQSPSNSDDRSERRRLSDESYFNVPAPGGVDDPASISESSPLVISGHGTPNSEVTSLTPPTMPAVGVIGSPKSMRSTHTLPTPTYHPDSFGTERSPGAPPVSVDTRPVQAHMSPKALPTPVFQRFGELLYVDLITNMPLIADLV